MSQQSANEWDQGEQGNPGEHSFADESGSTPEHGSEQWEHRDQSQTPVSSSSASSDEQNSSQEQYGTPDGDAGHGDQTGADPYALGSENAGGVGGENHYGQGSANQYGQPSANPQGDWDANQPYGQGSADQYGQSSANPQGDWNSGQSYGQAPPQGMPDQGMYAQQGMPNQGYPPQGGQMMSGAPVSQSDEKLWGMLTHVLMILTGFLGPLIVYVIYKDRSKWILDNAKESLNFGILTTIVMFVGGILTTVVVGFVVVFVWPILVLIFGIMAAVAANKGQFYKYPLNLRLVS